NKENSQGSQNTNKHTNLKDLTLKQISPKVETLNSKSSSGIIPTTVITAKVISINNDKIQLKLYITPTVETGAYTKNLKQNILQQHNPIITLSKQQLILSETKQSQTEVKPLPVAESLNFKPGQKIQLEMSNKGINPEFKLFNSSKFNLIHGQFINAKVIKVNNDTVQLALFNNQTKSSANSNLSLSITVSAKQLSHPVAKNSQNIPSALSLVNIQNFKPDQSVVLEVKKAGIHPEFIIIDNKSESEQKVLETVKQVLPIQQPVSDLVNQLIKTLPLIINNENVPDTLKRLAREILESIPLVKNASDPKQLKKLIHNSGLFLETKLAYSIEKNSMPIQADFKAQLLKLQYAFKKALNLKKTQQLQSNDLNLLKEMQQKAESSLAKIILNQLTSLPKDEGPRQVWILDIPFLNKESADSVRIAIDQEKQSTTDEKQENWTVNITVTPPNLDTIHCKVSCYDKTINTRFWSDTQDIVTKITEHLDYLKQQFEKAGINPGHMTAHTGIPNTENYHKITDQSLFDQEV
ncbi:MAG: flagellar hook-length control protein FliK, partial [Methylococcales bacterium]|nr:flagellar hook-length control protein FliK [Methylococcales bacterium]